MKKKRILKAISAAATLRKNITQPLNPMMNSPVEIKEG